MRSAPVLAIVPARGGSKGIPLKNLSTVAGKTLIQHVAELIQAVPEIDYAVVSTDHDHIAREAEKHGLAAPFRRPAELSGDRIGDLDVLRHAILEAEKIKKHKFAFVLMLQPTCPLRTPAQVRECLKQVQELGHCAAWTVSAVSNKFHPLKQLKFENGKLSYHHDRGASIVARQELSETYIRNGAAYAWARSALFDEGKILPEDSAAVITKETLVNIDTPADLALAEETLRSRNPHAEP